MVRLIDFEPKPSVPRPSQIGEGTVSVFMGFTDNSEMVIHAAYFLSGRALPTLTIDYPSKFYNLAELYEKHTEVAHSDAQGHFDVKITDRFREDRLVNPNYGGIYDDFGFNRVEWTPPRRMGERGRTVMRRFSLAAAALIGLYLTSKYVVMPLIFNGIEQSLEQSASEAPKDLTPPQREIMKDAAIGMYSRSNTGLVDRLYTPAATNGKNSVSR